MLARLQLQQHILHVCKFVLMGTNKLLEGFEIPPVKLHQAPSQEPGDD